LAGPSVLIQLSPPPGPTKGKPFERVMKSSVLLFARSNDSFRLSDLCGLKGGLFDVDVQGGAVIDITGDNIELPPNRLSFVRTLSTSYFPLDPDHSSSQPMFTMPYEQSLLGLLKAGQSLCLFPSHNFNMGGDFYLLLRRVEPPGWLLVEFQCKDIFGSFDPGKNAQWMSHVVTEWRKKACYLKGQTASCHGDFLNPVPAFLAAHAIDVVRVLCTNNPIDPSAVGTLGPDEAMLDRVRLRNVVPTAAYNMEGVHRVRNLFSPV
jgi:hypothetical protein